MDIRRQFLFLCAPLKDYFDERLLVYGQLMVQFDDLVNFFSYNFFNRRNFYFIALCSKASLTLFSLRLIFTWALLLWFRASNLLKLCWFEKISTELRKEQVIVSKLLKWLNFKNKVHNNQIWVSFDLFWPVWFRM